MADVSIFDVSGGGYDTVTTAEMAAAAAAQTVPCENGKDQRLALRVTNGNASAAAIVQIAAGDGPRATLGAKSVTVAAGKTVYIALFDTARFKTLASDDIGVSLVDSEGSALGAEVLANISIEGVQL